MRKALIAPLTALAMLASPASGLAAERYVDVDTGDDQAGANDCLAQASPCRTIARGLVASGSDPDTILVDDGLYPEADLDVGANKTLTASNIVSADSGATVIDPGTDPDPVITTALGSAPTVSGFTIRNDSAHLVEVNGPATISGNIFDETNTGAPVVPHLLITAVAGDPTVSGNQFVKSTQTGTAIRSLSADSPLISGNQISRYNGSIDLEAGTPRVVGNDISQQTGSGICDPCAGIYVSNTQAAIEGNHLHDPVTSGGSAIAISELNGGDATGATLVRNSIRGGGVGVEVQQFGGAFGPLSLFGDAIAGYAIAGLKASGNPSVSATNVTLGSAMPGIEADVSLGGDVALSLDSSIVSGGGIAVAALAACSISFSRGPVATPGGNGCSDFQTTASPALAGAADPHLLPGSAMIDAGNPAAPPGGAMDIDGDGRALAATCSGTVAGRRDIGADEFAGAPPGCGPAAKPKKAKCKRKKRKAKRAAASAKPKKKCKRKRRRKR